MPPLTTAQKNAVRQFVELTGTNDKVAQKYLKDHRYKTELAVNAYLHSASGSADSSRLQAIEKVYDDLLTSANGDTREKLSTETSIEYLQSLGIDLENAEMFVMMELVQAPAIGEITRKGFVDGWAATDLKTFSLAQQQKYIATLLDKFKTDPVYFKKVYRHAFIAGKEEQQKALAVDNALVYWKTLFSPTGRPWVSPKHDWLPLWEQFIQTEWTRSVNKDMWNQVYEFALKTMADEELDFYSDQDAWPGVIDDFVVFYRKLYPKPAKPKDEDIMDED